MKLLFIAGPYRGNIKQNIATARLHAEMLWKTGRYFVLCPHLNSAFMDGIAPDEVFLRGDIEALKRCDVLYLLPKWQESEGSRGEYAAALQAGLEIIHADRFLNVRTLDEIEKGEQ